eukprot:COSAG02_NODE_10541_length_1918_cov_1.833975_1_plen_546_part_10
MSKALKRAMEGRGLSSPERQHLYETGVSSVAWLDALRPEDFRAAGIDIKGRREAHMRRTGVRAAMEDKERAQQQLLDHTLGDLATDVRIEQTGTNAGRQWDEADATLVQAQHRLQEQEQRVRTVEAQYRDEQQKRESDKAELRQWLDQGALEFQDQDAIERIRLTHSGYGIVTSAITSLQHLASTDLGTMRALGLNAVDSRLLDSMRQHAMSHCRVEDYRGAVGRLAREKRELESDVRGLEEQNEISGRQLHRLKTQLQANGVGESGGAQLAAQKELQTMQQQLRQCKQQLARERQQREQLQLQLTQQQQLAQQQLARERKQRGQLQKQQQRRLEQRHNPIDPVPGQSPQAPNRNGVPQHQFQHQAQTGPPPAHQPALALEPEPEPEPAPRVHTDERARQMQHEERLHPGEAVSSPAPVLPPAMHTLGDDAASAALLQRQPGESMDAYEVRLSALAAGRSLPAGASGVQMGGAQHTHAQQAQKVQHAQQMQHAQQAQRAQQAHAQRLQQAQQVQQRLRSNSYEATHGAGHAGQDALRSSFFDPVQS